MYKKYIWCVIILAVIVIVGSVGYWLISGGGYPFFDYIYMTVITITTIGFGEVIDLAGNTGGRIFTVFIALSGIGVLAYIITNLTATVVEGQLTKSFRRRRMEKFAEKARGHYIVCGMGWAGHHIVHELRETKRSHIIIDVDESKIEKSLETLSGSVFIEGDATDNNILLKAGIEKAAGLFAVTPDDNQNLVICFSARQLNPALRIVAQCNEIKNQDKMKQAGADSIVSPGYISGMRMASEMIRPTVVGFLDRMMRGRDEALRVEEIAVPKSFAGKPFSSLDLKKFPRTLVLAIKKGDEWIYNPSRNECSLDCDDKIIVMTTPEERKDLEGCFNHEP
ncbi:MAG: potassium channel protein [Dehalococcoidales bacterium]|jgi:voltage-gated potassium channel